MGTWNTALFANDLACDVRDHYHELLENGVDDAEASRQTLKAYEKWFDDDEEGAFAILALAVTQSKVGRLDVAVRDRALAAIEGGRGLGISENDNPKLLAKRREVLEKARAQIAGPQPVRKRIKPPAKPSCGLVAGDVLALDLPGGPAILRVVRVSAHRKGETPYLEELKYEGRTVPPLNKIERLEAKVKDLIAMVDEFSPNTHFAALADGKNAGWLEAGFRKVATIAERTGDKESGDSGYGVRWSELANDYRIRR